MSTSEMTIEQLQSVIPNFRIVRRVGKGAFKVVYEVTNGQEHFALKVLGDTVDYTRLKREIGAMRMLQSPYIAKLEQFEVKDTPDISIAYLLEEFIDGQELKQILDGGKIYTSTEVIMFLDQVLQGLEACWSKRIVHRDIKPANIMVRNSGTPVIVDFGLSRHLDQTSLTPTEYPGVIGTPLFAPPEVLNYKKDEIDSKTDLYSLGVTVYMMITGTHPYVENLPRMGRDEIYHKLLYGNSRPPHDVISEIPIPLSKYVTRLINRNRVDRPKDATHARQLVQNVASQLGVTL